MLRDELAEIGRVSGGSRPALTGYPAGVERESTEHGRLADEDLKKSVEGLVRGEPVDPRSQERRRLEDPGDDAVIEPGDRAELFEPSQLSEHDLEARAELARLLTGVSYPVGRDEVLAAAFENGADEATLERLEQLPEGSYDLLEAVWEALGGQPEIRDELREGQHEA